jgi:hypothetical protein
MRSIFKSLLVAVTLTTTPSLAFASQAAPNQKEMAPLQYLVGTWSCLWQAGSTSGSEQQVFEPAFDGAWLVEKEIVQTSAGARVRSLHYTGYDPAIKMFVHVGPDANGTYELAQSPDAVTWHSADGSFVHQKVSDTKRTMTETDNGRARVSMTCTKT